jgi:hypothetical protein
MTVQYVSASDVQAALNMTYDSVNKVYTVYGLTIAEASVNAHVDFANTYINALLGRDLTADDPKYPVARMAALDLACMRVLVVSSGGAMIGAFDYFLGDLRVARAGPYAEAIERTIKGFQEDFVRQLVNLTTPVKAAEVAAAEEVPKYRGGLISP